MTKNTAASIRARLAKKAKETGRPFQEVLQYFGMERFLYRLAQSEHAGRFILKGALMLRVWNAPTTRPTRDIDLLGYANNSVQNLEGIVRKVCAVDAEDDGVSFDATTVKGARIKEDADYEGVRIKFAGKLENARIPMQIDVGFGDVVNPSPKAADYPVILDLPPPTLRMYPRETVVAEKLQAMVFLGTLNSRMKDFYDIWLLGRQFDFDGATLVTAVRETFEHRGTEIATQPVALTDAFTDAESTRRQWAAFRRRILGTQETLSFADIAAQLREFLLPVCRALANSEAFEAEWAAPGPWREQPCPS